jgi:parallel beta-helix repeat protein
MKAKVGSFGIALFLMFILFSSFLYIGSMNARGSSVGGVIYDGAGGPWTIGGSPYTLIDNVIVPPGKNLTIGPGVKVYFNGDYTIYVNGFLNATGTESQRILISSNDENNVQINSTGHAEIRFNEIKGLYNGVKLSSSSKNNLTNNIFSNNQAGIELWWSANNHISDNYFTDNNIGIGLWYSSNFNTITNNTIISSIGGGISAAGSSKNNISNNEISTSKYGISLFLSSGNYIYENHIQSGNGYGIKIEYSTNTTVLGNSFINDGIIITGEELFHFSSHTIGDDNLVDGKRIYYYKNEDGITIANIPAGQLILANCTNVLVEDVHVANTSIGLELGFSRKIVVTNSSFSFNVKYGIYLLHSSNNTISKSNISSNYEGIFIAFSPHNKLTSSDITENSYKGVTIDSSSSNRIYHNNFINNSDRSRQVYDNTGTNFWNETYPSGGNYWSDYSPSCRDSHDGSSVPQYSGSADGFCDEPYNINSTIKDYYPLKNAVGATSSDNRDFFSDNWWLIILLIVIIILVIALILIRSRKKGRIQE